MKIMKVYTKTGDKGETSIVGGIRVKISCRRLDAYGTVDELNSHLGLLASMLPDGEFIKKLGIYNRLPGRILAENLVSAEGEIRFLEEQVDGIMRQLPERQGFILPGGCQAASQAHVCRTVCRRAERCIVALSEEAIISPETLQFVNRLSDYLFVLAKIINFNTGVSEIVW